MMPINFIPPCLVMQGESEKQMKEYKVSYYLGDMYHTYLIDADNEYEAATKALHSIVETSRDIFHDFRIERYYRPW